uniref:Uncharacterized protein n=1 Tax=Arundo donax TaxID=35708 RepID=A0A0A9ELP3_ARUDO
MKSDAMQSIDAKLCFGVISEMLNSQLLVQLFRPSWGNILR